MRKLLVSVLLLLVLCVNCAPAGLSFPAVSSFSAEPSSISPGGSATLKWSVSGATSVSIDNGVGNVALTGERTVTPKTTTIYTLTATNPVGASATATAQVLVPGAPVPPATGVVPVVDSFTANTNSIPAGSSAILNWNVSNATSVTIDQGVGTVSSVGTVTVSPSTTTNYTLSASNAAGVATRTVTITVSAITFTVDLRITTGSPVITPSSTIAGGTVGLSPWTVKNEGAGETGSFANGFYLSGDAVIMSTDTYLAGNNNNSLTAGAQFNWGGPTLTIPPGTPPGNYYIGILIDRNNAVNESNENNNYVSVPITVTAPLSLHDLLITTGSPIVTSSTVKAGETVGLSPWTVKYEGTAETGPFANGFYLSADPVIWSTDTYLGGNSNGNLTAGAQFNWDSPILTIPPGTTPGNYYIGILVDRNNVVSESNENNNYVSTPIKVTAPTTFLDLIITTGSPIINPTTVNAGGTVGLSAWTVKNEGTSDSGPFLNGFYLSTDLLITSTDTYLDGNNNSNLAAGAQFNWGGPTLTIPPGTPPGNYYIGILVDRANAVTESNENNNHVVTAITVN
jgi:subtilase family serine protease